MLLVYNVNALIAIFITCPITVESDMIWPDLLIILCLPVGYTGRKLLQPFYRPAAHTVREQYRTGVGADASIYGVLHPTIIEILKTKR